jgi:hypothetical protein
MSCPSIALPQQSKWSEGTTPVHHDQAQTFTQRLPALVARFADHSPTIELA